MNAMVLVFALFLASGEEARFMHKEMFYDVEVCKKRGYFLGSVLASEPAVNRVEFYCIQAGEKT